MVERRATLPLSRAGMGHAMRVRGPRASASMPPRKRFTFLGTDIVLHEGDVISIDGGQGIVVAGAVPLVKPELTWRS